jgi:hypothetical protein
MTQVNCNVKPVPLGQKGKRAEWLCFFCRASEVRSAGSDLQFVPARLSAGIGGGRSRPQAAQTV